ncbi:HepT-like ribonuclease domain-containing protein [Ruania zhangjianzhongii]|uniref:HepT-like ribonuclease domain-containing protein n=1 Tax=Ruania zhangjianzhongii TaxID=2603206 RepID=UPI0011C9E673
MAWPQIRGFRNVFVHQCFGVDADIVRGLVEAHLPPLAEALRGNVTAELISLRLAAVKMRHD